MCCFLVCYLILIKCMFILSKSKIHIFICFLYNTITSEYLIPFTLQLLGVFNSIHTSMLLSCIFILFLFKPYQVFYFVLFCIPNFLLNLLSEITFFLSKLFPLELPLVKVCFWPTTIFACLKMSLFHPHSWNIFSLGLEFLYDSYFISPHGRYYSGYPSTDFWLSSFSWSLLSDSSLSFQN